VLRIDGVASRKEGRFPVPGIHAAGLVVVRDALQERRVAVLLPFKVVDEALDVVRVVDVD